jgi:hypothetical protein
MSRTSTTLAGLLAAATAFSASIGTAAAGSNSAGPTQGYVIAYSHDGNGSIKAPWRDTPRGRQVRLPHGTWVYCRTSCSETLRVQTIDIWANVNNGSLIGAGTIQNECGVLGCLHWEWSF